MKTLKLIQTTFLLIIGFITFFMSASILFDWFEMREKQGDYITFVVAANFVCAFLYLFAVSSNLRGNIRNSARVLGLASLILVATFIAFLFAIKKGVPYELKTVKALTFRTVFTFLMTVISIYLIKQQSNI